MTVNTIIRISYASIDITSFINVSEESGSNASRYPIRIQEVNRPPFMAVPEQS